MDSAQLIPTPEAIPAPAWIFQVLDIVTFSLHILLINVLIGSILIVLFSKQGKVSGLNREYSLSNKIPTLFALGINLGIAPLLFLQVIYGQFIYSSSILMALFWILVIPALIIAYYGSYIFYKKSQKTPILARCALAVSFLLVLYIAFTFVNNMTLMVQPGKWISYFSNNRGTILNLNDPAFFPRYAHFLVASVAIGGLFSAIVWNFRKKQGKKNCDKWIKKGLSIFAIFTCLQVFVGIWFLLELPQNYMLAFMGSNMVFTIILSLGIILTAGVLFYAFRGKLMATIIHLFAIIITMVISRANLRTLYLSEYFTLDQLEISPQYDVMILFFSVFIAGLLIVTFMIKMIIANKEGEAMK